MVRPLRYSLQYLAVIVAALCAACGYTAPTTAPGNVPLPILTAFMLNPPSVPGGQETTATVTFNIAAPAGTAVFVSSNSPAVRISSPVPVVNGATTATFKISTPQVGAPLTVGVTVFLNNSTMAATLSVTPVTPINVTALTVNPTSIPSGNTAQGTITLSAPAFPVGQPVDLTSSNPQLVSLPSPVTVGPGLTTLNFSVFTSPVAIPTSVTITARLNSSMVQATVMLTLPPAVLTNLSFQPNPVVGGSPTTGKVTLSLPAPPGGILITLATSDTVAAPVPPSVNIPAGATQAQFMVTPQAVNSTAQAPIITATQNMGTLNAVTQSVTLNIVTTAVTVTAVTLNPSTTTGGLPVTGTVTLSNPGPQGGTTVMLSSSNPAATVPQTVVVLAGGTSAAFPVMTSQVLTAQMATVTATLGASHQMATLTVNPPSALTVSTLTLNPTTVEEGLPSTGTVTISGPAQPGGTTVVLTSSDPSVGFQPSANLLVTAGATSQTFTVTTTAGTAANATITATLNGTHQMAMLAVVPPPTLVSVVLNLSTLVGGSNTTGTITISAAAPGGVTTLVTLTSTDPVDVQIPATVPIAAGSTTAIFPVTTLAVTSPFSVTITAALGAGMKTAVLMLTPPPPTVTEIFFNPPTITAGQSSTGTLVLNAPAPAGGATVTLTLPAGATAVTLPSTSIVVAAGASTATFTANAAASVAASTGVLVTATLNTSTQVNGLTVIPAPSGTLSEQIIVGGETTSTDFPTTTGAFQTSLTGADSGTLTSINLMTPAGGSTTTTIPATFSTFFGNSNPNLGQVRDIFVDSTGNIFACGVTSDSALPVTAGVVQGTYGGGNSDAFVVQFDSTGHLKFLTYLGGSGDESCNNIFVDLTGNIFVSGRGTSTNFPGTTGVVQLNPATGGVGGDFFVAKLNPGATTKTWFTYLGGISDDQASGRIAVDSMGNVYVSGMSRSITDFPVPATQGRPNMTGASTVGVVVKLNPTATTILFTTFLFGRIAPAGVIGGTVVDATGGVAVNSSGVVYVCGAASATDLPVSSGAFQTTLKGQQNAYVARLSSAGAITALTLLGGTSTTTVQACKGLAVDSEGNIIVVTPTDASNYPVTTGATLSGPTDFAVTKLTADLSRVIFSTLVGGSGTESADATRVVLDASENIYFSLATNSANFPVTAANAFQPTFKGLPNLATNNMAIVKLSADGSTILYSSYLGGSSQNSTITLGYHKN